MYLDLRSDTITRPTEAMRKAMSQAIVGDDVYGEDPTVNELEKAAAKLVNKQAEMFIATGTMGNQVAILTHTQRGDEVIVDSESHIFYYEAGAPAILAGVQLRAIPELIEGDSVQLVKNAHRDEDIHYPKTSLVCLENTFNRGGGTYCKPQKLKNIYEAVKQLNLSLHLDGARIFNAAVAEKCNAADFTAHVDTIMFCLSKGLSAPVGSILAGDKAFIDKARKYRKILGGGMRQAGILAAAGLESLKLINRLEEDHDNAKRLALGLVEIDGLEVNLSKVQTNIVNVKLANKGTNANLVVGELQKQGIRTSATGINTLRLVTHREIIPRHIPLVITAFKKALVRFT